MPEERQFTDAQRRALAWLPPDGTWCGKVGRMGPALDSLRLYHRDLIDSEWADAGPRGGRLLRRRLTAAGIVVRTKETR